MGVQLLNNQESTEIGFGVTCSVIRARRNAFLMLRGILCVALEYLLWKLDRASIKYETSIKHETDFFPSSSILHHHPQCIIQVLGEGLNHVPSINIFVDLFSCFCKLYLFASHKKSITVLRELKIRRSSKERSLWLECNYSEKAVLRGQS